MMNSVRKNNIIKKIEHYIDENHMLQSGDHVAVGVSGGADSMCLLFVLMTLAKKRDIEICAVHIHHGIRGEEADADALFVENFCREHGLMWKTYYGDIPNMAKTEGISEEEAGRKFRYACFEQALSELGWLNGKIAVAHNKNDTAETLLMNIFRGSGIHGLAGIPRVRGNIIRPLLCLKRQEIEELLSSEGIGFCTDRTNLENDYTRNRIRNEVLPYILENVNSAAIEHMADLSDTAGEVSRYMNRVAQEAFEQARVSENRLSVEALNGLDAVICREVLRKMFECTAGRLKDFTREHVRQTEALINKPVGRRISLPYGIIVRKDYDCLVFEHEAEQESVLDDFCEKLILPEHIGENVQQHFPEKGLVIEMSLKKYEENERIIENQCTKCFDYDKIKNGLIMRCRQEGDYLTINSHGSRKLLRRLMIDEKIPEKERGRRPLIADGTHVLWLIGVRTSAEYRVTGDTQIILQINIKGEE